MGKGLTMGYTNRFHHPQTIYIGSDEATPDEKLWTIDPKAFDSQAEPEEYRIIARSKINEADTDVIFLQPWCVECEADSKPPNYGCGREWCQDDVWGECGEWRNHKLHCRCKAVAYKRVKA